MTGRRQGSDRNRFVCFFLNLVASFVFPSIASQVLTSPATSLSQEPQVDPLKWTKLWCWKVFFVTSFVSDLSGAGLAPRIFHEIHGCFGWGVKETKFCWFVARKTMLLSGWWISICLFVCFCQIVIQGSRDDSHSFCLFNNVHSHGFARKPGFWALPSFYHEPLLGGNACSSGEDGSQESRGAAPRGS